MLRRIPPKNMEVPRLRAETHFGVQARALPVGLHHDIFPYLNVMQFGGKYPWWDKDTIEVECPDRYNTVSLKIEVKEK